MWFLPVLSRGKFDLELLPGDFPGETEAGGQIMVAKVRGILHVHFPCNGAPRILFTDRGNGFYESNSGKITNGYRTALHDHGLKSLMGRIASVQSGCLQALMLHETAAAQVHDRLQTTVPQKPWEESIEVYGSCLKDVALYINHSTMSMPCADS